MKLTLWAGVFVLAAVTLATSPMASPQGVGASADLTGTVSDPLNAAVPNARITAIDIAKGGQRTVVTDEHGSYRLSGLAPSSYKVSVEHGGFQSEVVSALALTVGQTLVLDFHLKIAGVSTEVEVTSQLPAVETERASQANTLTQDYIAQLPIDRRDYLTFTLLAPGVSNSTRLASDQDFRVKQTPQSGLSFYGSNGRGNSVTVDGGEANDDAGGVRLTLNQDAVQEFQVNRSNYSAELGGASGATINIVSKSGTNDLHGSLFGLFRNDAMDARDPFAFSPALQPGDPFALDAVGEPIKNSLNRQQFGGSVGFPIKKDKTFLFISFEGLRSDAQDSVPLFTISSIFAGPSPTATTNPFPSFDPRSAQQTVVSVLATQSLGTMVPCLSDPADPTNIALATPLPAPVCAGVLSECLTITPSASPCQTNPASMALNPFIINQFETNGGVFPFPTRSYLGSIRLDHRIDENNQVSLRYNAGHLTEKDPDVQALTAISRGTSELAWDSTLEAAWIHQFSPTAQNELRLQW